MCSTASDAARTGLSQRIFARLQALGNERYEQAVAPYKRDLFGSLQGTVVEIGPGTGVNLAYYPDSVQWIGVEPNVFMHDHLRAEADRLGRTIDLRTGTAERLPVPDASVDAVVSTLVLCSVDDVAHTLGEIRRVLKPGGRFVFIEHVAAPGGTWRRRLQQVIRPLWKVIGDGCRPDRETGRRLEKAGFAHVDYQAFTAPVPVVGPHIAGVAVAAEEPLPGSALP